VELLQVRQLLRGGDEGYVSRRRGRRGNMT
jgi:hypothetical protein